MAGSSLVNVCRYLPTAGSTANFTFSSAVTGYQSPTLAGVVNGALYSYRAESADLSQWEIGQGAYTTGTGVLARTTVLSNNLGTTALINFTVAPQVALVALAPDLQKTITTASNILGADVLLNNITTFFAGPSMAQGTVGTWLVGGSVTCTDTAAGSFSVRLTDGTTIISTGQSTAAAGGRIVIPVNGIITAPAGNIRINVKDGAATTGKILFNVTGDSKDSSIWGIRIA